MPRGLFHRLSRKQIYYFVDFSSSISSLHRFDILKEDSEGNERDDDQDTGLSDPSSYFPIHHESSEEAATEALYKDKRKEHRFYIEGVNVCDFDVSDGFACHLPLKGVDRLEDSPVNYQDDREEHEETD